MVAVVAALDLDDPFVRAVAVVAVDTWRLRFTKRESTSALKSFDKSGTTTGGCDGTCITVVVVEDTTCVLLPVDDDVAAVLGISILEGRGSICSFIIVDLMNGYRWIRAK